MSSPIKKIGDFSEFPAAASSPVALSDSIEKVAAVKRRASDQGDEFSPKRLQGVTIEPLHESHGDRITRLIEKAHEGKDWDRMSFSGLLDKLLDSEDALELQNSQVSSVSVASHALEKPHLRERIKQILHAQLKPQMLDLGWLGKKTNPVSVAAVALTWSVINPKLTQKYQAELAKDSGLFDQRVKVLCEKHHFDLAQIQGLIRANNWQELMDVLFPA